MRKIVASNGVKGLWLGWSCNVVRNGIINAAEISSYDQTKQMMMQVGFVDGPLLHAICAVTCSAVAAVVGSPADVVKTRAMANIDLSKVSYSGIVRTIY